MKGVVEWVLKKCLQQARIDLCKNGDPIAIRSDRTNREKVVRELHQTVLLSANTAVCGPNVRAVAALFLPALSPCAKDRAEDRSCPDASG